MLVVHHARLTLALGVLSAALTACQPAGGLAASVPHAGDQAASQAQQEDAKRSARSIRGVAGHSTVADLVERVSPTVVNISTVQTASNAPRRPRAFDFFAPRRPGVPRQRRGAGTGFIIDATGYVVTNAHVVQHADEVTVRLHDDRQFKAEVVGQDRKLDLALLKISGLSRLPTAPLGDSHALRVGEQVLAVGNPFGLGHTVTMGIVSAKARSIGAGPYDEFIQTDASINPGNSGGPLFNLRGEVIGINTAIRAGADGIGFAIPVSVLKGIMAQLRDKGYVERGKLGLAFQAVTPELAAALGLAHPQGALVSQVLPASAAKRAGIQAGDLIVAINGVTIKRASELPRNVARHAPGTPIRVLLRRQGAELTLTATLDKLAEKGPPASHNPAVKKRGAKSKQLLGINLENDKRGGVRVVGMSKAQAGIQLGDIIVELNHRPIRNVRELRQAIAALKKGRKERVALVKLRRGKSLRYAGLRIVR